MLIVNWSWQQNKNNEKKIIIFNMNGTANDFNITVHSGL